MFQEGDVADRLFLLIQGRVEILLTHAAQSHRLAVLGPGQYFGEMAALLPGPSVRLAGVRALESVDLLSISKQDADALIENLPALREALPRMISPKSDRKTDPDSNLASTFMTILPRRSRIVPTFPFRNCRMVEASRRKRRVPLGLLPASEADETHAMPSGVFCAISPAERRRAEGKEKDELPKQNVR